MPVSYRLDYAMMSRRRGRNNNIKMYSSRELPGGSHSLISSSRSWKFISPVLAVFITIIAISSVQCVMGEEIPAEQTTIPPVAGKSNANAEPKSSPKCTTPQIAHGRRTVSCVSYATIPDDISDPQDVNVLVMNGGSNKLQILGRYSFSRLKWAELNKVDLRDCSIRGFEQGAFMGGESIIEINLSNNLITTLDPEVFVNLERLTTLYLQNNPINRFVSPEAMFPPKLNAMTYLDLSNCKLDTVPVKAFNNLLQLKKLSLNNNKLAFLDWRVFRETRLETLNLANNPWHCDCQVKFLKDTLSVRSLSVVFQHAICASTGTGATEWHGKSWNEVPMEQMTCSPKINKLEYTSHDVMHSSTAGAGEQGRQLDNNNDNGMVKLNQDVYFECEYSGYPKPEIKWFKDKKEIKISEDSIRRKREVRSLSDANQNGNNTNDNVDKPISNAVDESSIPASTQPPLQPKIQFQDVSFKIIGEMEEDEKKHNYKFRELLILRRVQEEDKATYTCLVRNVYTGMFAEKMKFLNVSGPGDEFIVGGLGGKKRAGVWMWILVGVLCVLILILMALVAILAWRRREKRKQDRFRKVVSEKFKDSNIDLGEFNIKTVSPNSQQSKGTSRIDGATPLLDNGSEASTILISDHHLQQKGPPLPDVALGNVELIRNSQIFSPKPPPAAFHGYPVDARKEFFARQISEPYLRPGSAMSFSRPPSINASQRRYIFANHPAYQSEPVPIDPENPYAVPSQIRTLPRSGSAMSMSALPEHDLRRQMFMRQQSNPYSHYGTASRVPARRIPSTSSEPPFESMMGAYNYSTLPRRPVRLQSWSRPVSPSNSTCSTYSTLSWRPNLDPYGVASDGVGVRKGACGGSQTSINRLPDMNGSVIGISGGFDEGVDNVNRPMLTLTPSNTNGGKMKSVPLSRNPRYGHNRTPSSLTRGHNDFFSFEPIQEVESSECASTQHLDRAGNGRQTPTGYTTQSLARGEPRYKKKKPPSISMIPANLKTPSRAFEHLKGRSVSPALRNNVVNGDQPKEETAANNVASSVQNNRVNGAINGTNNSSNPVLESPIDEEIPPINKSVAKAAPPAPPPKPKRNQEENNTVKPTKSQDLDSQKNETTADGTVV